MMHGHENKRHFRFKTPFYWQQVTLQVTRASAGLDRVRGGPKTYRRLFRRLGDIACSPSLRFRRQTCYSAWTPIDTEARPLTAKTWVRVPSVAPAITMI